MNVPAIRKALERLDSSKRNRMIRMGQHNAAGNWDEGEYLVATPDPLAAAVVRVGLRACDVAESACRCCPNGVRVGYHSVDSDLLVIADILREAGVEVSE